MRCERTRAVAAPADPRHDPEAIALRIHQIACTAGVLAEAAALDDHGELLSHALNLIEETLLEVEERVEELRHVCMCDTRAMARPKRPTDFAQRAKLIVDMLTGQAPNDSAAVPESARAKVGREGGLKGGKARARKLSPQKRRAIAKKAAAARWSTKRG